MNRCAHHGCIKTYSHDVIIDGVPLGVYVCPVPHCETMPDFGAPMDDHIADTDPMVDSDNNATAVAA